MTTAILIRGWEHGLATPVTNGGGIASGISLSTGASATVQGTIKRTGSYALRLYKSVAGSNCRLDYNNFASTNVIVGSFYIYFAAFPDSNNEDICYITVAAGVTLGLKINITTKKIYARFWGVSDGNTADVALSLDTWYRIDYKFNVSANPNTIDFQVNGTAATQSTYAQAATTFGSIGIGGTNANTSDVYYDDEIYSATAGDYPIGAHAVRGLRPNADGTHNNAANILEDSAGNDIDGVTYFAYDKLDESPWTSDAVSDYVRQTANGANNYCEVNFAHISGSSNVLGVQALLQYASASATSNNGGCVIIDEDALSTTLWGVSGSLADYSETSAFYKSAIIRTPTGNWDEAAVNALKCRFGYSSDANPDPYWLAIILEAAYVEVTGNTYEDSFSLSRTESASDSAALTVNASFSLNRVDVQADNVLGTYNVNVALPVTKNILIANIATIESALIMTRNLRAILSGGLSVADSLELNRLLSITESAIKTSDGTMTLNRVLAYSDLATVVYETVLTLQRSDAFLSSSVMTIDSAISLARYMNILISGGLSISDSIALSKQLLIALSSQYTINASIALGKQLSVTDLATVIYETAITFARNEALSLSSIATFESALSLLRSLLISTDYSTVAQTYEEAFAIARIMALTSTGGLLSEVTLSLSKNVSIALLSGLLLNLAVSINRKDAVTTVANHVLAENFTLLSGLGISVSSVADLAEQLTFGRSLQISSAVVMTVEEDVTLGKSLVITVQGGLTYNETLTLSILQALSLTSELIEYLGSIPAKIVINDQTIWLITGRDRLVSPDGIINSDNPQSDISSKDLNNV